MSDADNQVGGTGEPFSKQDQNAAREQEDRKKIEPQRDQEAPGGDA